ncbi:hypothetical protein ACPDI4_000699 [Campylobacter upsaliensis]
MKILKNAGFLEFVRKGTWAYYEIKKRLKSIMCDFIARIRAFANNASAIGACFL